MVAPVSSNPAAALTATTDAATGNKPLDKEAFLKLLVAQIAHQDPLQPMQGTEFVTQLSQFSIVEQAIAQSSHLDVLSTQLRGIANNDAVALVGKGVLLRSGGITFDGVHSVSTSLTLPQPSVTTKATIVDARGKTVRTLDLGPKTSGALPITWDGKTDEGGTAPPGAYRVVVEAHDAAGKPIATSNDMKGTVTKVTFDKGYPELLLDTGATGPISDLVEVQGGSPAQR
jgi:flagellar basal-body rod modification protein FlgD